MGGGVFSELSLTVLRRKGPVRNSIGGLGGDAPVGRRIPLLKKIVRIPYSLPALSVITKSRIRVSRLALIRQHTLWNIHLPTIQPYYAVKSNPDPTLLKWIRAQKTIRVDCASPGEMDLCLRTGFETEDILYANTMKAGEDLQGAADRGIRYTTTDSVEGVHQLAGTSWRPTVLVRLAVDDRHSRSPFSIKFGATEDEWKPIVAALRQFGIPLGGVSFHVGSASSSPEAFTNAIELCKQFQAATNTVLPLVDIGGGFLPNEDLFVKTAAAVRKAQRNWIHDPPTRWIAEPGRFFSAPTQTLLAPIVFKKVSKDKVRYLLDESVYGQFSGIVYDHAKPQWKAIRNGRSEEEKSSKTAYFFGKTCDSLDLIAIQDGAPDYEVGDVFAFPWMGAYSSASATTFNGFDLPAKSYINDTTHPLSNLFNELTGEAQGITFPIETRSKVSLSLCQA